MNGPTTSVFARFNSGGGSRPRDLEKPDWSSDAPRSRPRPCPRPPVTVHGNWRLLRSTSGFRLSQSTATARVGLPKRGV
ncbi:unnamed protein product [Sphagnum jensenii]|jgi:hypothetical protein|uniref:Uncharacterized protein n=1 Tax=Sphagnum jensenii TaxID=128206 RepID=A0ABP0X5M3_9BRYO